MPSDPSVAELTLQAGRLTITVRETAAASSQSHPPASFPAPARSPPDRSSDQAFLSASTAAELEALDLGAAQALVAQLRGADSV